jgi:hypothetical protein
MEMDGWILIGGAGRGNRADHHQQDRTRNVDYLTLAERRRRGERSRDGAGGKRGEDPGGVQVVEWGCMFVSNAMLAFPRVSEVE